MSSPHIPFKRLCLFSDGSWANPESAIQTNIVALAKCLKYSCSAGVPQLIFYDPGVGTGGSLADTINGGAFGQGIDRNIQELYSFLALNYCPGDEVYLFGYSRGAYTVRSLAGMIYKSGLVGREHLDFIKEAYDMYRSPVLPDSDKAQDFRAEHGERIPIKLVACFDTVGALGLPQDLPLGFRWSANSSRYRFHDTELNDMVENGIHAVSIDEDRKAFEHTEMKANAKRGSTQVTEMFLPGHHAGIGGEDEIEAGLSENAVRFVVDEMRKRGLGLEFDMEKIPEGKNIYEAQSRSESLMNWAIKALTGRSSRKVTNIEALHESAVRRWVTVESWRPKALEGMEDAIRKKAENRA